MFLAIDVHYKENRGQVVGVLFQKWEDDQPSEIIRFIQEDIAEYEPGAFYKRELPCILELLKKTEKAISVIIVDGYVYLDNDGKPGLGYKLYECLDIKIPVIGVAKTRFHNNEKNVVEVLRGESNNPLFVSAIGMEISEAATHVKSMSGEFRLPTLLKLMDTETKKW
jgi:deoxyribonuclease V